MERKPQFEECPGMEDDKSPETYPHSGATENPAPRAVPKCLRWPGWLLPAVLFISFMTLFFAVFEGDFDLVIGTYALFQILTPIFVLSWVLATRWKYKWLSRHWPGTIAEILAGTLVNFLLGFFVFAIIYKVWFEDMYSG
jgi:hypothetical protein